MKFKATPDGQFKLIEQKDKEPPKAPKINGKPVYNEKWKVPYQIKLKRIA